MELDDSTADADYQEAILIKAAYPVTDVFNLDATAGYTKIKRDQQTVVPVFNSDLVVVNSRGKDRCKVLSAMQLAACYNKNSQSLFYI